MNWDRDLSSWPLSHVSRRLVLGTHRWHIQEMGSGETLLLLHGAGATTHSWRAVIPLLAQSYHVVAIDLPGQGFTQVSVKGRFGLQAMTEDIAKLCEAQNWRPFAIIGHSAGAAIALNLADARPDISDKPARVIGINAALSRFEGLAGWLFPLLAKLLALSPLVSHMFAAGKNNMARARRLIEGTGSALTDDGVAYYARLISDRDHVEGALQMMAQWRIDDLLDHVGATKSRCLFVTGAKDIAVKPEVSKRMANVIADAEFIDFPDLGHMLHEEEPEDFVEKIVLWLKAA